jgi:predicted amidohydrolase YtcJ
MIDARHPEFFTEWMDRGPQHGICHGSLSVRGIKLFSDGALGSRGAALFRCYSDDPSTTGLLLLDETMVTNFARTATRHGFQVCTHAIGDRANHVVLNAYEATAKGTSKFRKLRPRIEHAQIVSRDDSRRFGELGVIASVQTSHCSSDLSWAESRLGATRCKGAYAWSSLRKEGALLCNGSDAPIEGIDPLYGLYAAVSRMTPAGSPAGGWNPRQRLSLTQALESYTIAGAYAGFEEQIKGSITPGKLADLVVLNGDLESDEPRKILKTRVAMTILGGRIVWQND